MLPTFKWLACGAILFAVTATLAAPVPVDVAKPQVAPKRRNEGDAASEAMQ